MRTDFETAAATAACLFVALTAMTGQTPRDTPYKLGTFQQGERSFVGLVLNDAVVLDLSKADPSLPSDMTALLRGYDALQPRLASLAASAAANRPPQAYDVATLKTQPPVMPQNVLNAAVN